MGYRWAVWPLGRDLNFMSNPTQDKSIPQTAVRSYEEADHDEVARLYSEGLLAGQIAPNDSGADLDYIREAYFDNERHHFWVAVRDGRCVGMIGVASDEEHTAERSAHGPAGLGRGMTYVLADQSGTVKLNEVTDV